MSRAVFTAALFLAAFAGAAPAASNDEEGVRVVLLTGPDQLPPAERVQEALAQQLSSVGVRVEVQAAELVPDDGGQLEEAALDAAAEQPGTLALIGWGCGESSCLLYIVETRSGARTEIPVAPGDAAGEEVDLAFALASTSREMIVGSLLPELRRLTAEGASPSPPPPTGERLPQAYDPDAIDEAGPRPWLWIEGGYYGEHPYPQGRPLHGPWLGLAMAVGRSMIPVISVGWLGVQEGANELGVVHTHGIPVVLGLRIAIPVGPATFALAPVGRLDVLFVKADPVGPRGAETQVEVELHMGGQTTWHLPLPGGVEALLGAGILGTVLGRDYEVEHQRAIPASRLRFGWWVGMAWSPLK